MHHIHYVSNIRAFVLGRDDLMMEFSMLCILVSNRLLDIIVSQPCPASPPLIHRDHRLVLNMVLSFDDRIVSLIINEPATGKEEEDCTSHERHERAAVLCSHSDAFRAMLQPCGDDNDGQSFKEAASLRVEVNGFSIKTVDHFLLCLQACYLTGGIARLTISHELLDLVLPLAVYYQSHAIIDACLQHVKNSPPDVRSISLYEKHVGRPDGGWAASKLETIAVDQLGLPYISLSRWYRNAASDSLRTLLDGMSSKTMIDILDHYQGFLK